jgi:CheY-like chemotaxis protein
MSESARFFGVVLLVEDNPVNQLVACEMLRLLGVTIACAGDGVEAIERLEQEHYDLIFMDIQMPRMDGLEATREIRRREQAQSLPPTPIVALTANSSDQDRARCLAAGMDDLLGKPVQTDQLTSVLARFLRRTS